MREMRERIKSFFNGIAPLLIFFMLEIVWSFVSCENQIVMRSRLDKIEREIRWKKNIIESGNFHTIDSTGALTVSGMRVKINFDKKDSIIIDNLPTR